MNQELMVLTLSALSIGVLHTALGPDHYLPFIVLSKTRNWSLLKTSLITFVCGVGHVLSSVVIGLAGVALGLSLMKLEALEAVRGNLAAWALIGFGFMYFTWGLHQAIRGKKHTHLHSHEGVEEHSHQHSHTGEHIHPHKHKKRTVTWTLFIIFVLGPCEPLIPILMYPAAKMNLSSVVFVAGVFALATIATMMSIVLVASCGLNFIPLGRFERYSHAAAGAAICLSGLAIQVLGL